MAGWRGASWVERPWTHSSPVGTMLLRRRAAKFEAEKQAHLDRTAEFVESLGGMDALRLPDTVNAAGGRVRQPAAAPAAPSQSAAAAPSQPAPLEAEFVSAETSARRQPAPELPPGVLDYNGKQWQVLEIAGQKVVLQMRRADGSVSSMKKRIPLSELSAEQNVRVREVLYAAKAEPEVAPEPAPEPEPEPDVADASVLR